MTNRILAKTTASISELKKNPMGAVAAGNGEPVAILNRNAPAFYCIPTETYEALLDYLDSVEQGTDGDTVIAQPANAASA